MELQWQDPPTASRKSKWKAVAAELQTKPNAWALLRTYKGGNAKRNAYSLAGRLRKTFGPEFRVTSRGTGDDEAGVWAQYAPQGAVPTEEVTLSEEMTDEELLDALGG